MTKAAAILPRNLPERAPPAPPPQVEAEAPPPKWRKATTREGKRALACYTNPDAWRQFRRLADDLGKSQQDLLVEALNDMFSKHGVQRIAD